MTSLQAQAVDTATEPARIEVTSATVITGTHVHNHATVIVDMGGKELTFESTGKRTGPVDAICHAFESLVGEFVCKSWSGRGESEGSEAIGRIDVLLRMGDETFHGSGHDTNTMVATARAVADALNKHRWHRWKNGK